jgi:hypothetical protein
MWNTESEKDKVQVFENMDQGFMKENSSSNIINELMLSANELNIYGKSSLIEYNNLDQPGTGELLQQIKNSPENAYKTILKNKLEKLNHLSSAGDFYVKPIPK